ncbi:MAG: ABC transporter permease [Nocardioidaceae bacterium]|nr:ABC transporter permease [Nocardioidaceae bacterium]
MSTRAVHPSRVPDAPLAPPGAHAGLFDVFRRRYLLGLLVHKEIQARYQASVLGLMWSYVQPLVRFMMYFFVIGVVLGLHKNIPNFAIHMFAAIVVVNYFTETFTSGTRAIVRNKAIVRKMAMPREMFPVAAVIVSAIHTFPQVLILFVACISVGWSPDPAAILAGVLGIAIITVFGTALALLFSAMNVFFRDFQNIVATLTIFTHWAVPMLYPYSRLANSSLGDGWFIQLYLANPLTEAVLLMQRCLWVPTVGSQALPPGSMPDHLFLRGFIMLGAVLVVLVFSQLAFTRLETKIAERL